jgi:hypothetical protein
MSGPYLDALFFDMSAETLRPEALIAEAVSSPVAREAASEPRFGASAPVWGEPALLNRILAVAVGIFAIPVLVECARLVGAAAVQGTTQLWTLLAVALLALGFSWLSWGPGGSSATLRLARTLSIVLAAEALGLAAALSLRFV